MRRICAWCKATIGESAVIVADAVTHGICPVCERRLAAQIEQPFSDYLDLLDAPVVVVNVEGKVRTANQKARQMMGKDYASIVDLPTGNVFECEYSYLPQGCGNTEHCPACTIRNAVMTTMETGETLVRGRAFLRHRTPTGVVPRDLLITTEKVDTMVLLRIDEVS